MDACRNDETWCLAGFHPIAKTMSAHEIPSAVSALPERLPGGLGILQVEQTMEARDDIQSTRLRDTLSRVLERMISPTSLALGIRGEEWFQQTAITIAQMRMDISSEC